MYMLYVHCQYALPEYCVLSSIIGSVSVDRVTFSYTYNDIHVKIYFNNLMENPFLNYGAYQSFADVPCILNQLVFRNTHTKEIFQAEYMGRCTSYDSIAIQISMNPRDFLTLIVKKFIDINSTTPLGLEMYTADMLGAPFNLRIEPDNPIECDLRLNLRFNVRITDPDYLIDEGILLIHFTTFIDVATVNTSKLLSLSRNYYRDANNTVNITSGEVLNQSPGLTKTVAIRLTSSDQDLLASKGLCIGNDGFNLPCYVGIESGYAAAYFGVEISPTTGNPVYNFWRNSTGDHNNDNVLLVDRYVERAHVI